MATPHISAEPGDFAPHVLMPGDPRRAQRIAETFLEDPRLVTEVRGILGYTGTVDGQPVSVMASGMGSPSISIYATELARFYGVKRIIRVGTVGSMQPQLKVGDVIAAAAAHTTSAMTAARFPGVHISHTPDFGLLRAAVAHGEDSGKTVHVGSVLTSDDFYNGDPEAMARLVEAGTLAVEMEAAALYAVGMREKIETLMLGTVSDGSPGSSDLTAQEREDTFTEMVGFALAALSS